RSTSFPYTTLFRSELWLSELPRSPRRHAARRNEKPGMRGDQRRWAGLVSPQRLARNPTADRGLSAASPARPSPLADPGGPPHERRSGPLPGAALAPRITPAGRLRDRARPRRVHRAQRVISDARALPRPGHVADPQARPARRAARRRRP